MMKRNQANFNKLRQNLTNLFEQQEDKKDLVPAECIGESLHFSSSTQLGIAITEQSKQQLIKSIKHSNFQVRNNRFESQYELGRTLGEGAHAVVKLCWPKENNSDDLFAVKITRSGDQEIMENMRVTFLNSISLNHPYIVKHYKLYLDQNEETAYLLMDYCPYPSLEKILKEKTVLSEEQAQKIFKSLFQAVHYFNSKGICHRDLKPDNILINKENLTVRVTDFGVSKRFKYSKPGQLQWDESSMWTVTGNIHYCAPEIFHSTGYTKSVDVWSVGVVLYQSLCGSLPYSQDKIMEFLDQIGSEGDKSHFERPSFKKLTLQCQDLIKRLLKIDPNKRLTPKNALMHPWFHIIENQKFQKNEKVRDDTQIKKSSQEGLATSEQFQKLQKQSRANFTQSIIEEVDEGTERQQKIKEFKQNNELENIHMVMKDSTHVMKIDFVSSYHSMTFQSVNIKSQNTEPQNNFNKVEKMLSTDPFFANNNMMMICDSDEDVNESPYERDINSSFTDANNCII